MSMREGEEAAFNEAYASLNAAQKKAVDTIEGPVMVIAGPGTGKTQILTLRIANILRQTDVGPGAILALTFTDSGEKAMRNRLRRYIGSAAYQVTISTFHGFCESLIRKYPDAYERIIGGQRITRLEEISFMEEVLASGEFSLLRKAKNPGFYIVPILDEVSAMKREHISPDRLRELIAGQEQELQEMPQYHEAGAHKGKERSEYTKKRERIDKNRELLSAYMIYDALLRERRRYDFNDMISETILALESNEAMLREVQETYQYVLADEHQDVNGSQNRIIDLIANYHHSPNVFVVGDEKQAIYRFQGASLENFLYFEERFKEAVTIDLRENYRSAQQVLDAAQALITSEVSDADLLELRVPLTSKTGTEGVVSSASFTHQAIEDHAVIARIKETISAGTDPAEIAIIVRTNREVEAFTTLLRKAGIAARPSADGEILDHPLTKAVEDLLRAVCEPENEAALFSVLHGPYLQISAADLARVLGGRSYSDSLPALISDKDRLQELGVTEVEEIVAVHTVLTKVRVQLATSSPIHLLESLITKSRLLSHVMEVDPLEGTRVVRRIYDEVERLQVSGEVTVLSDVGRLFNDYRTHRIPLEAPYLPSGEAAVAVMTAHRSKGLEFDVVFIPHLTDSAWGGRKKGNLFDVPLSRHVHAIDAVDDERRLLYVALTRARFSAHLSSAEEDIEGRSKLPSRLLEYVDEQLYEQIDADQYATSFDALGTLSPMHTASLFDQGVILEYLGKRGFSPTSFNNYLESPWTFLYRNILRVPEVRGVPLMFGSVVHGVLEELTNRYTKEGTKLRDSELITLIERELARLPIDTATFTDVHAHALACLTIYREHLYAQLTKESKEEVSLKVSLPTNIKELPELPLSGKLDRIDINENGLAVRLVDYKTGKPKSRNDIEGKTKNSNGNYKRQLTFYALLLELHGDERLQPKEFVLSFVEPDGKGKVREESFEITKEEIEALKIELIAGAVALISGDSFKESCDPAVSDYCALATRWMGKTE